MKQIRTTGSYEVVIYDLNDKRVVEYVKDTPLYETKLIAGDTVSIYNEKFLTKEQIDEGFTYSYTISRILHNSAYDNWAPKQKEAQ